MKRFVALALVGSFPLVASAGNPVSVNPPAQPSSMNQPLSAAVQAAGATLPPAPVMTSQPTNWGGGGCPSAGVPCGDPSACSQTRPYFNPLAPRGDCGGRGTCLDRLKEWVTYHPEPCNLGLHPTPYMAPLRTYFTCRPGDGSPGVGCGAGCGAGCAAGRGAGRGGCGAVEMPVKRLSADGCDAPACRPRVRYTPQSDCGGTRPRLLDRLFGWFSPKGEPTGGDNWCAPVPYPYPAAELLPANPAPPMPPPTTSTLPTTTVPANTPTGRPAGKSIQLSPQQPFTNP